MKNKVITFPCGKRFHTIPILIGGCVVGWDGVGFEHLAMNGSGYFSYGPVDARTVFGAMKKHGLTAEYHRIKAFFVTTNF